MRCSVSGLSLLMFIFVTLGDSTYVLSVLLFSVEKAFIIRTLPWIAGSGWSVIFDVFVSYDFECVSVELAACVGCLKLCW